MRILRTDEARFESLPDYPFSANYFELTNGLRLHYVDEGPRTRDPILMLHGEPSWSYLYRKMIPIFTQAGFRAVTPDLIGFGKSDKPASRRDYSYQNHVDWMSEWLQEMALSNITLVCQDWGSLIGLRLVAAHQGLFGRVVLANGGLPTGDGDLPKAFKIWQAFSKFSPILPVGRILQMGTATKLSKEVLAAYDAPFPGAAYKAGARTFPSLVPTTPDDPASQANRDAWEVLKRWDKPFLTAFSDGDPITRGGDRVFQRLVPGAKGQRHTTIQGGGHFLQEDKGETLAATVLAFLDRNAE
ncbi:MAG: haloalkane dehalogenase [Anaerolineae bacterium]|nr:haloalkane dehalogenase [Anaerolineae bacterium]